MVVIHCPEYYKNKLKSKRRSSFSRLLKRLSGCGCTSVTKLCYIKDNIWETKEHLCGKCMANFVRQNARVVEGARGPRLEIRRKPVAESRPTRGMSCQLPPGPPGPAPDKPLPPTPTRAHISPLRESSSALRNPYHGPHAGSSTPSITRSIFVVHDIRERHAAERAARSRLSEPLGRPTERPNSTIYPLSAPVRTNNEVDRYMWASPVGESEADIMLAEGGLMTMVEAEEDDFRRRRRERGSYYDIDANSAAAALPGHHDHVSFSRSEHRVTCVDDVMRLWNEAADGAVRRSQHRSGSPPHGEGWF
jgi:hypothetical protein